MKEYQTRNPERICYNWMPLIADHVIDLPEAFYRAAGTSRLHNVDNFDPDSVKSGDLIFVKTDYIVDGSFRSRYMNRIDTIFNLITGVSSYALDHNRQEYEAIVEDSRVNKWICTNPPLVPHKKLISLPIGFQEPDRLGGNQDMLARISAVQTPFEDKKNKIFLPYHDLTTNPSRAALVKKLSLLPFVDVQTTKQSLLEYYKSLDSYKFVIGLAGRGGDIHRNYETMLVGSIPISTNVFMWDSFVSRGVDVICLDSWEHLNNMRYKKLLNIVYNIKINEKFLQVHTHMKHIKDLLEE